VGVLGWFRSEGHGTTLAARWRMLGVRAIGDPPVQIACAGVLLWLIAASSAQAPVPRVPAQQPQSPPSVTAPVAESTAATATLDLKSLEERLRATKAIGLFTKITLKNQIDDLLDRFRDYYKGKRKYTMKDLRRSFDLLLMKVLSLLQDEDQTLAAAIGSSREALWALLADPKTFATLDG
jgi:hypothetical protein